MDSMIEKVAREICLTMWGGYPVEEAGREQWSQWEVGRNLARVVIKALREPTPEMVAAGTKADWVGWNEGRAGESILLSERYEWLEEGEEEDFDRQGIWAAMIEAALKEQEEKQA